MVIIFVFLSCMLISIVLYYITLFKSKNNLNTLFTLLAVVFCAGFIYSLSTYSSILNSLESSNKGNLSVASSEENSSYEYIAATTIGSNIEFTLPDYTKVNVPTNQVKTVVDNTKAVYVTTTTYDYICHNIIQKCIRKSISVAKPTLVTYEVHVEEQEKQEKSVAHKKV